MDYSMIMYDESSNPFCPKNIFEMSATSWIRPVHEDFVGVDAVELHLDSLDKYHRAVFAARELFEAAGRPMPPTLIRINTCLAATSREALRRFNQVVGIGSMTHRSRVWYVGSDVGLRGFVEDLSALRMGDGIRCIPLRETVRAV